METNPVFFKRWHSFWYGLKLPFGAAKLIIRTPALMTWSIGPILVTVLLYFYVIGAAQDWVQEAIRGLFDHWGLDPAGWVRTLLEWTSLLLLWIAAALTFAFSSSIVASPFNDFLAEKAERFGSPPLPPVGKQDLRHMIRTVGIDLVKTLAAATAGILAFLFSLIPLINLAVFAVAFLLVAFQYISYPQTRREVRLRDSAKFLWHHLWACLGFGATISFFFSIPLLSSLALPVAVVGGTLLVARAPGDSERFRLK